MSFQNLDTTPSVAIIGRPNVGKSTLFNILTDTRKAVVKNQPGVTRDILIEPCELWGKHFNLIDTGGLTEADDTFSKLIRDHVIPFIQTVDMLLLVMDGRSGLCHEDRDVVRIARESKKPFLIVVNKVDKIHEMDMLKAEFYEFGDNVVTTSFEQRHGLSDILEWLNSQLPEKTVTHERGMTLTIVGKPNVGKSSLCNRLLGTQRMLVSEIAGTTVDAVDCEVFINEQKYNLIDTAGLRRSGRREEDVEIISAFKSHDAIRKADLVLLMIDANEGPSEQDAKILSSILESHKGVILVANKTDLAAEQRPDYRKFFKDKMEQDFHFFPDIIVNYISVKTGSGIKELFNRINEVREKLLMRITTSELNDFFFETIRKAPAPVHGVRDVKFYYLTQTKQVPPSFIAFANYPEGVTPQYRRFLAKQIAERWDLKGIPIRIFVMKSRGK